jgi:hypothetical protein
MGLNLLYIDEFCIPENTLENWTMVCQKFCILFLVNSTIKYFVYHIF